MPLYTTKADLTCAHLVILVERQVLATLQMLSRHALINLVISQTLMKLFLTTEARLI